MNHVMLLQPSKRSFQRCIAHPNQRSLGPCFKGIRGWRSNFQFDFWASSFDHKSCISCINEQYEGNLGIYISKPFQWYLGGPIWCLFTFPTKALNIQNLRTNVTPICALGSHWVPSLALSPVCESVFHIQTYFLGLMGPYTPHLVVNPMLRLWHMGTQINMGWIYCWKRWFDCCREV